MKKSSTKLVHLIRDFLFFACLIILLQYPINRVHQFIAIHKDSPIHELDLTFFDRLKTTQRQLDDIKNNLISGKNSVVEEKIKNLQQRIYDVESKYSKNSPSMAFLGPIGTASILLKEKQLGEQLSVILQEIDELLNDIGGLKEISPKSNTETQKKIDSHTLHKKIHNLKMAYRTNQTTVG